MRRTSLIASFQEVITLWRQAESAARDGNGDLASSLAQRAADKGDDIGSLNRRENKGGWKRSPVVLRPSSSEDRATDF